MKTPLFAFAIATFSFAPLDAASIILVTNNAVTDASLISFLEDGGKNTVSTGAYDDISNDAPSLSALNAADLVLVSRNTNSGDYASSASEKSAWAGVTSNLWLGSAFLAQSNRWAWSTSGTTYQTYNGDVTAPDASMAAHPIYSGVTSAGAGVFGQDKYKLVSSESIPVMNGSYSLVSGGTMVGVRNSVGNEYGIIAEFEPGAKTGDGDTFGGNRLFFALPENFDNIHADALPMYQNALDYALAIPEPSSLLLGVMALGFFLRRQR